MADFAIKKLKSRGRIFVDQSSYSAQKAQIADEEKENSDELLKTIRDSEVGFDELLRGPFGERAICYADYTASGRSLRFIEEYLFKEVMPLYGNTHSSNSATSMQMTLFRHEARAIVQKSVNANWETDVVIFTGAGTTAAINQMIGILGIGRAPGVPLPTDDERPVVFIGPFEHHSNILPWRESMAQVVAIRASPTGGLDMDNLKERLSEFSERPLKIGSFSAASNVTGIITDTIAVSILLHEHKALALWDCAACGPHGDIDMNPPALNRSNTHLAHKDAIFLSPHKYPGGPGCPGVLVIKKELLDEARTSTPGGGTVFFVTDHGHQYVAEGEAREEGGTPDIIGSIRCGLVFQLTDNVGADVIHSREQAFLERALKVWDTTPNFVLMGPRPSEVERIGIVSFMIKHGKSGRFLHYNFVVSLLNDLFGIQARGGCLCAGPYGQMLLGMDSELSSKFQEELNNDDENEVLRPGFVRLNMPYFLDDECVDFIIAAVKFIAELGHVFLTQYTFTARTSEWKHIDHAKVFKRRWLASINYKSGSMKYESLGLRTGDVAGHRRSYLAAAHAMASEIANNLHKTKLPEHSNVLPPEADMLRWFIFPSESLGYLQKKATSAPGTCCLNPLFCATNLLDESDPTPKTFTAQPGGDGDFDLGFTLDNSSDDELTIPIMPSTPKPQWAVPTRKIMHLTGRALVEHSMIRDGDRILVGLSGGKDSLSLLHVLHEFQRRSQIKFDIGAVTVDPQTEGFDPRPLIPYLKSLGVPYFYEGEALITMAKGIGGINNGKEVSSICSWCSRMKRGMIYSCMRRENYNVLAFGQHLDDTAESFVMSAFFNGVIRTMKAHYTVDKGDLRMIRPLVYVREKDLKEFAYTSGLPIIVDNCPGCFDAPEQRYRIKQLLSAQEAMFPGLFGSLLKAMMPVISKENSRTTNPIRRGGTGGDPSGSDEDDLGTC